MELVDGPTLAERIAQGPLSPEDAIRIAAEIAEASGVRPPSAASSIAI